MSYIYCPEGTLELPIDMWKCKLNDQVCPIHATINQADWQEFHRYCLAPAERQQGIRQAIEQGKYAGFHHMPGRYQCACCKPVRSGSWNRVYHYREDLYWLNKLTPYDFETLHTELATKAFDYLPADASAVCRDCLTKILSALGLPEPTGDELSAATASGETPGA